MTTIHSYTGDQPTLDTHAQGPLPRPRRRAVDDPDLDRRRQGRRPRAAGAQRQARRRVDPRADAERLGRRFQVHRQAARPRSRRSTPRSRPRPRASSRASSATPTRSWSRRTSTTTRIRRSSTWTRPRSWTAPSCRDPVLVRQRVGLLQPHGRHRRRDGQADLTGGAGGVASPALPACNRGPVVIPFGDSRPGRDPMTDHRILALGLVLALGACAQGGNDQSGAPAEELGTCAAARPSGLGRQARRRAERRRPARGHPRPLPDDAGDDGLPRGPDERRRRQGRRRSRGSTAAEPPAAARLGRSISTSGASPERRRAGRAPRAARRHARSAPISGGPIRKAVKAISASVATFFSGRGPGTCPTIDIVSG